MKKKVEDTAFENIETTEESGMEEDTASKTETAGEPEISNPDDTQGSKKPKNANVAVFTFSATKDELEDAIARVYQKNRKKYKVQGFRAGKVPRQIIEKLYGLEIFFEDAANDLLPGLYSKTVIERKLRPISDPEISITKISKDHGIDFVAKVAVFPDFELKNYKGIKVKRVHHDVSEADVDAEFNKLREKNARIVTIEDRPVQDGDYLNIDYEVFLDGKSLNDVNSKDFEVQIGSKKTIPGFEDELIGKNSGETFEFDIDFPAEFYDKRLEGKRGKFNVHINRITEHVLPELDDEFAKDISEFDTLGELRTDIKTRLEKANANREKTETEAEIIHKIAADVEIDVPDIMVRNELKAGIQSYFTRLGVQNVDVNKFLDALDDAERARQWDAASAKVKSDLILDKVINLENIEASDAEVDDSYEKISKDGGISVDAARKYLSRANVEYDIKLRKAMELLSNEAVIED
jgi:trigger factor